MMLATHCDGTGRTLRLVLSLTLFLCAGLFGSSAQAQLTGTRNIPGDYADLAAAITDLNTQGVGAGGVTINLVAANPQTAPAGGYAISLLANTSTVANPVIIEGNGNTITASAAHTVGALNDALFKIIGSDSVTVRNFVLTENAANTVTAAATNTMTEWGVAVLYATTTDGAQNAVISGNTIDLNRTYQNTFAVYSNSTHSASAPTTTATATTPAGSNTGLIVRGNTITDVNVGIVVVGPTAAADHNDSVAIGGALAGEGNNINNFGTTGTFSSYANVSGSVFGILVRNSRNIQVQGNTVASSNGGITAGTTRGIYVVGASNPPTGTFTHTLSNNIVSLRPGAAAIAISSIVVEAGAVNATATLNINNNTFNTTGHTVAGTAAITFIASNVAVIAKNINGNVFDNLNFNTTGAVTLINNNVTSPANAVINVNNNSILTGLTRTSAGALTGYLNNSSSPNTVTETNTGNNFSNVTVTGASTLILWQSTDGATPGSRKTVTNNTFSNITAGTNAATGLRVGFSDNAVGNNNVVSGNTVSNINGAGAINGIVIDTGSQNLIGNTVSGLTSSGASTVAGITVTGTGTVQNVARNKVYDLTGNNGTSTVVGLLITNGTTVNADNNLIGNLFGPAMTGGFTLFGIDVNGGTTINASFNTVHLSGAGGANFGATALRTSSTPTLNLRGNNLVNLATPAGTGQAVAFRRTTTTLTSYGAVSNNNNFYAGTPGASNLIFSDGTNLDQTLAAFKARVASRDSASVTENAPFLSTVGASAQFLHINPAIATQLESGAAPIAGIPLDFDGDTRSATAPDIGADEFTGIVLDLTPPAISYTPFGNTTLGGNRVLAVSITDLSGIAGGANAPRIYFNKNAGAYVSTQCTGSSPNYNCTIDNTLLGGVTAGDVVAYFVIAQDTAGNVGSNPGLGLVAVDVNTVTTPPTTPATYNITTGFPVAVNVGTGQPFTSLTNAGGLFEAINAGVFTASVVATVTSDLSVESGAIALNPIVEEGAGGYTLTIQPDSATERLIGGSAASGLIRLNGADRVTIDGRFGGTGKFLRLRNTNTGAPSVLFINDATSNNLRSLSIESGNTLASSATVLFSTTTGVLGNSNNLIADCDIRDRSDIAGVPANSVLSSGSATVLNAANTLQGNNVFNFTFAGILVQAAGAGDTWTLTNNNVFQTASRAPTVMTGISIQGGSGHTVTGNAVGGGAPGATGAFLSLTGASSVFRGIDLSVGNTPTSSVQGNVVKNIRSTSTSFTASHGIFLRAGAANIGGVAGNTIGSADPNERFEINTESFAIQVISTVPVLVENNTVDNFQTRITPSAGGFFFGIGVSGTGAHTVRNNTVRNIANNSTPDATFDTQTIGMIVQATGAQTVVGNTISGIASTSAAAPTSRNNRVWGLILSGTAAGTVASRNRISNLTAASTGAGARIDVVSALQIQGLANATVSNNFVSVSGGADSDRAIFGILDLNAAGATANYYFNSVNVFGVATGANNTYAFNRNNIGDVNLRNNIFVNSRSGGTGFHVAMANTNAAATGWPATASNFNLLFNATPANLTQWLGAASANNQTLAGFQAASGGDANSISADPLFTSATDLHIPVGSPAVNVGTPVAGITIDIDGDPRTAPAPEIGADELVDPNTPPGITPTVGGITRVQASAASNSQIAAVTDLETGAGSVVVATQGALPTGITVTNIVNSGGNVTADVAASCSAATGANLVGLRATDPGTLFTDANLTVNVDPNTAPVLGTYPPASATIGGGTTVSPSAAPSDNGTINAITASAPGFTGTFLVNPSTGVVTVSNAGPPNVYTVTVTATDSCGLMSTRTFQLTVSGANTAPTIVASSITQKAGDASAVRTIANVSDIEDPENTLAVTINGGASATSNGVSISGISVTAAGLVNANVVAICSASNASFTLRVTDSGTLFNEVPLNITVSANTAPTLSYAPTSLLVGTGAMVNPSSGPSDTGSVGAVTMQSLGTYTGTASVVSSGVVTLGNAGPEGSHTLLVRATDNCGLNTDAMLVVTVLGDSIFGNGFEDIVRTPAKMNLPMPALGETLSLTLPTFELQQLANVPGIIDVVEFNIDGTRVLLQVRYVQGSYEMRLIQFSTISGSQEGSWIDTIDRGNMKFEWRNNAGRVEAVLIGSR